MRVGVMIDQCLHRRIDPIEVLRAEVVAWQAHRDRLKAEVNWPFTTNDARLGLKCLCLKFDK